MGNEAASCQGERPRDAMLRACDELATWMHATGRDAEGDFFAGLREQIEALDGPSRPTCLRCPSVGRAKGARDGRGERGAGVEPGGAQ